jgi:hypothetical protein
MNYLITLSNLKAEMISLSVTPEIAWDDFVALKAVKELLLLNPGTEILDITPEDMLNAKPNNKDSDVNDCDLNDISLLSGSEIS